MKRILIKLIVLLAVFFGGIVLFFNLMNSGKTENAAEMSSPTLPVMCANTGGQKINRMYGYLMEMDGTKIRDCIIPLTTAREITISYKAYSNQIDSVTYEVITPDTGESIENGKISNFKDDGEMKTATFKLEEPILMNCEYPIRFTINIGDKKVNYYARLLQRADLVPEKYVEFVNNFYETCTNKSASAELNAYLETDETVQNSNFGNVDIKSSLDMVSWGSLSPTIVRKAVPKIKAINKETCSITCDYLIGADDGNGHTEYYHVSEYYRLRYYNSKMMLLNFERSAKQWFDADNGQITSKGVNLGVSSRNVDYLANENADVVAFVQDGSLWCMSEEKEKLSSVFSFHSSEEGSDERDDCSDYGIKIMNVSDAGDIDFAVYGYMSRGRNEGKNGVCLYRFHNDRAMVEERLFIPYYGSNEVLEKDIEQVSYLSGDGYYYVMMNDSLLRIDLETLECTSIVSEIDRECFASSRDNSVAAWMDQMDHDASTDITLMDLETGRSSRISAGTGEYVRVLGFINNDFIYGTARSSDIEKNPGGDTLFAMYRIDITAQDAGVIKTYEPEGLWISGVTVQEGLIELERVSSEHGKYVQASTDDIMNNRQDTGEGVEIGASLTSRQGTVMTILFPGGISNISPLVSYSKMLEIEEIKDVETMTEDENGTGSDRLLFYVYIEGKLEDICSDPAQAVIQADAGAGTVVDSKGRYLFERGDTEAENELVNEDIPDAFLTGVIDSISLGEQVGEAADVVNLSGCTLKEVLYMVSCGSAVAARKEDGSTAVIVGYDRYNTLLYSFETGEHYYYGMNDSTALFEAGGNVFVSYIENRDTIKNRDNMQ